MPSEQADTDETTHGSESALSFSPGAVAVARTSRPPYIGPKVVRKFAAVHDEPEVCTWSRRSPLK
jgi:hypothetical protein